MFFIGSTDHRGTYFFHSRQHNGWVVADLDTGKARLLNQLALVLVREEDAIGMDLEEALLDGAGLGQDGQRWLVDGDDLIHFLRDYADGFEVLTVYRQDGSQDISARAEKEVAKTAKRIKKEFKGLEE
jgi:hypothetical protein